MSQPNFDYEPTRRRYLIVRSLNDIFLTLTVLAGIVIGYVVINNNFRAIDLLMFSVALFTFLCLLGLRLFLLPRHLNLAFVIISIIPLINAYGLMVITGTSTSISYLLITIVILSSGIVLGIRSAMVYTGFSGLITFIIYFLHTQGIVAYMPSPSVSSFGSALMLISFLVVILYLTNIGYKEIEHYYQRAYAYAKELETLNSQLDKKVKLRTKQLEKTLDLQLQSVYSAAILGRTSRAMLHDLSTPISTTSGALHLLSTRQSPKERKQLLEIGEKSMAQINRIINNGRNLMSGKISTEEFSPHEIINNSLILTRYDLQLRGIRIEVDVDPGIKILGVPGIFERIVLNLISNAVDELAQHQSNSDKLIKISGHTEVSHFVLNIEDNGRGIDPKNLNQIFDPEYSLKDKEAHLGLGLHFVKNSIEKFFKGGVRVESELGRWTRFILKFNLKSHVEPQIIQLGV